MSLVSCFKKFFQSIVLEHLKGNDKLVTEWNYFSSLLDKDPIDLERVQTYIDVATSAKMSKVSNENSSKSQISQFSCSSSNPARQLVQDQFQPCDYLKSSVKENLELKPQNQEATVPHILRKAHSININICSGSEMNHQLPPPLNSLTSNTTTNQAAQSKQQFGNENCAMEASGKFKLESKFDAQQSSKCKQLLIDRTHEEKNFQNISINGFVRATLTIYMYTHGKYEMKNMYLRACRSEGPASPQLDWRGALSRRSGFLGFSCRQ